MLWVTLVVPAPQTVRASPLLNSEESDVKLEAETQDTWHSWEPEHLGRLDDDAQCDPVLALVSLK